MACIKTYYGMGFDGYKEAIAYLNDYIKGQNTKSLKLKSFRLFVDKKTIFDYTTHIVDLVNKNIRKVKK